jgi:hypothetical protein
VKYLIYFERLAHEIDSLAEKTRGSHSKKIGGDDAGNTCGKRFPVTEKIWA